MEKTGTVQSLSDRAGTLTKHTGSLTPPLTPERDRQTGRQTALKEKVHLDA